jgi:hypothetical protein
MDLDQVEDIIFSLLLASGEQQQKSRVQTGQLGDNLIKTL